MAVQSRAPFNRRAFTALTAASSSLALAVTGLGLHAGRGEDAHTWTAAHVLLAVVFVVSGTWHACLNGRALARHVAGATGRLAHVSREAAWAAALVALALTLAIGHGAHPH